MMNYNQIEILDANPFSNASITTLYKESKALFFFTRSFQIIQEGTIFKTDSGEGRGLCTWDVGNEGLQDTKADQWKLYIPEK